MKTNQKPAKMKKAECKCHCHCPKYGKPHINTREFLGKCIHCHKPEQRQSKGILNTIHCGRCGGVEGCPGIIHEDYKQAITQALVDGLRKKKQDEDYGKYCGCDGECFASCPKSFNKAIDEAIAEIEKLLNIDK